MAHYSKKVLIFFEAMGLKKERERDYKVPLGVLNTLDYEMNNCLD